MRILIAEDDRDLNQLIKRKLKEADYSVDACFDGEEVFDYLLGAEYDVLVLDIMMPKLDGLQVLERLRKEGNQVPVLLLTARDSIEDRVAGLDAGADDYLVKPFAFEELLARLRVLLRKPQGEKSSVLRVGGLGAGAEYPAGLSRRKGNQAFLQGIFPAAVYDAERRYRPEPG